MIAPIPIFNDPKPLITLELKLEKKEPKKITVAEGDTLESLAKTYNVTVQRLFNANPDIADPNLIKPSQVLVVPENTDVLTDRPMPATIQPAFGVREGTAVTGGSSIGNTYSVGFCTHYAKQRRPDLPNSLGNADTWYIRYNGPKGSEPRAGAIGVAVGYMHVVYVESVNADGTVNISEQNYKGWGVVSSRVAPASEFLYIY